VFTEFVDKFLFAVLKRQLLRQRETEASFCNSYKAEDWKEQNFLLF